MQTAANDVKRFSVVVGATVVPTVLAAACALLLWGVATDALATALRGAPLEPAGALVGTLAGLGVLLLGWMVLGVLLEVLALVPGAVGRVALRASAAVSPRVVRRAVAVAVTVGVGAGVGTGGAQAAPARAAVTAVHRVAVAVAGDRAADGGTDASSQAGLPDPGWAPTAPDPGWTPTAPTVRPQPDLAVLGSRAAAEDPAGVVVRRGDSLWAIAARHLGEGASDAEVAAEWPRWYDANRGVVGEDPDLLRPGQVLRAPAEVAS